METNLRLEKKKNIKKFKSYYVVWKLGTMELTSMRRAGV